jgi:hypothetical protein
MFALRFRVLPIALTLAALLAPASAKAAAGAYTGWQLNSASGCYTRAQTPYLDLYFRVVAYPQVWCPRETVLTVRARIRSDRTLSDATVGTNGCTGYTSCTLAVAPGTSTFTVSCNRSSQSRHGYHSDILIYPGMQFGATTNSTSSSITYTSWCGA